MDITSLTNHITKFTTVVVERTPTLIGAIVTLIVGWWFVKQATKIAKKWFEKSHLDVTVSKFLGNLVWITLKILLVISVAGMFGIQTTSFVAIIWAAWLAIWLSLQWSLQNFAGGVLILVFKPYIVWDLIEAQDIVWKVELIDILYTKIVTPDNKTAVIPNGDLADGNIVNYSQKWCVRIDVPVWIAYESDIDHAKRTLLWVLTNEWSVLESPAPLVAVTSLWDNAVNLVLRYYCVPDEYFTSPLVVVEQAKKALDSAGIGIPFPQRVVHMVSS